MKLKKVNNRLELMLGFSLCRAVALDTSLTETHSSEAVNRTGITASEIGEAVIKAIQGLDCDLDMVIVRFSDDT